MSLRRLVWIYCLSRVTKKRGTELTCVTEAFDNLNTTNKVKPTPERERLTLLLQCCLKMSKFSVTQKKANAFMWSMLSAPFHGRPRHRVGLDYVVFGMLIGNLLLSFVCTNIYYSCETAKRRRAGGAERCKRVAASTDLTK